MSSAGDVLDWNVIESLRALATAMTLSSPN